MTEEDMHKAEKEMSDKLDEAIESFEKYKNHLATIESIADAFESQCKALNARNELLESLLTRTTDYVKEKNWERLERLYTGLTL